MSGLLHAWFRENTVWACAYVGVWDFFPPSSSLPAGWLHKHTNQTSPATMDCVWMKNASVPFTYSSRRKIFLQGRPLEMWHSHARPSAATLPTRFSIKQVNNTIPTPINKWLFLNKVLYTEPLTKATRHNLMWSCTGQIYSPSSSSCLYIWAWLGINRGCWNMRSIWAVTIIIIVIIIVASLGKTQVKIQHYMFRICDAINVHFSPSSHSFFLSYSYLFLAYSVKNKKIKNKIHMPVHKLLLTELFSLFLEMGC